MDIATDNNGTPMLAVCQGAPTDNERSEWMRQLQIPMIYDQQDGKGFVLVYRAPTGAATIEPLPGPDRAKAAEQARSFLAGHPEHAVLNKYGQEWTDYNQRESGNLMNIVAVIYGVALTAALSSRPSLLLHPVTAPHFIPSLALLVAALLTAFAFFSYVISVGGDKPYNVTWTLQSSKAKGILGFFADLVLASLYVHLLFAAVHVEAGPNMAPKLAGFLFAFIPVLVGAVVVWWFRGLGNHRVAWGAIPIAFGLWAWAHCTIATRGTDLSIEGVLLLAVLAYSVSNQWLAYRSWRTNPAKTGPPRVNG